MNNNILSKIHKILLRLPPELAHKLAIWGLTTISNNKLIFWDQRLQVNTLGMTFRNPVGLAAGFDKNGEVIDELLNLGFGFVEVGTVTPLHQSGNKKPRLFRLSEDNAIINRMGFNNHGSFIISMRMILNKFHKTNKIIGVSVGPNSNAADYSDDITYCIEIFAPISKYVVINISSPNTSHLRDLQEKDALSQLLFWAVAAKNSVKPECKLLIKISPDISVTELDNIIDVAIFRGIDGMIISNTTVTRPENLISPLKSEPGGLSGPVLFNNSLKLISRAYTRIKHKNSTLTIIGSGGIVDGKTALAYISAGASIIQIYTGFIYQGPKIIEKINDELLGLLDSIGAKDINDVIGISANSLNDYFDNL